MGNFISDFFNAAFPWIAGGIALAIIITYGDKKNKKQIDK
jgi:hypothetical protein